MIKKILLFGSGAYGLKLLKYFGKKNVYAFCDNDCPKRGYKYEILYITIEEFYKIYKDYLLVLSVNSSNAYEIALQLWNRGIEDFLICNENLLNEMLLYDPDEYLRILNDEAERMKRERNQYIKFNRDLKDQLEVLKGLSDIRQIGKAKGYLSYVQSETIKFTAEVFEYLKEMELGIRPFVVAGTAIGLYRHHGFIPWDDDVDFGLLREDYMKLMQYGKEHLIYVEVKASIDEQEDYFMERILRYHPNEYIIVVSPNCLQIKKGTSEIDCRAVDFFPYDFYEEGYDFEEHKKVIELCANYRYTEKGNQRILEIISQNGHIVENSNTIYFGLDSMDSYVCPNKKWMDRDILLPLIETEFEGVQCYAPHRIGEYLSYCFKDYEGYPKDLICHHLREVVTEKLKRDYVFVGLIVMQEEHIFDFLPVYKQLRKAGIYCVYVVIDGYVKSFEYNIRNILIQEKVEYIDFWDEQIDFLLVACNFDRTKMKDKPIFLMKEIKDIPNIIEHLTIRPKKKELVHWQ